MGWRRYLTFSVISQLFNAGTNFLLVVLLARSLSARGFGVQALALTVLPLVLAGFRGVCLEPAVVHGRGDNIHRLVLSDTVLAALLTAVATALIPVLVRGSVEVGLLLAVGAGAAVLEEAARWLLARGERPELAALADVGWAVVQLSLLAFGAGSALVVAGSWAAGGLVSVALAWGAVLLLNRAGRLSISHPPDAAAPVERRGRHRRRSGRRNWHWGLEYLAAAATPQLVLLTAPLTGGVEVAGALSAAFSLCGVATVVVGGAQQALASRLRLISSALIMRRWAIRIALGLGGVVLVCLVPLLLIPTDLGTKLLGDTWTSARLVLPAVVVQRVATAVSLGPIYVTRRLPNYRVGFWARLPLTVVTVAGAMFGAAVDGPQGAAAALASGALLSVVIWSVLVGQMTRPEGEMERYFAMARGS
jgi:hypothetical protein